MRGPVITALALAFATARCTSIGDDLPEVKVPPTGRSACPTTEATDPKGVLVGTPIELNECAALARRLACEAAVSFTVDVDGLGEVSAVRFPSPSFGSVQDCIRVSVNKILLIPATDSCGKPVGSSISGSIAWSGDGAAVERLGDYEIEGCCEARRSTCGPAEISTGSWRTGKLVKQEGE